MVNRKGSIRVYVSNGQKIWKAQGRPLEKNRGSVGYRVSGAAARTGDLKKVYTRRLQENEGIEVD